MGLCTNELDARLEEPISNDDEGEVKPVKSKAKKKIERPVQMGISSSPLLRMTSSKQWL